MNSDNLLHPLSPTSDELPHLSGENGIPAVYNPPRRGQFMTPEDLQNIQSTVNEFLGKAALPYVERQTKLLHESVNEN